MNKIELKPKYVAETFNNQKEFDQWLAKTTFKELILADLGQDMTKIYVAESGEILHCNFHASIYNGRFVNMAELSEFCPLEILENGQWVRKMGLLVDEIKSVGQKNKVLADS